jgi:hypothetical protein
MPMMSFHTPREPVSAATWCRDRVALDLDYVGWRPSALSLNLRDAVSLTVVHDHTWVANGLGPQPNVDL